MRIRLIVVLLAVTPLVALADSVRTLDGKVYDGKAAIDAAGVNVTVRGQGAPVNVPFAQLLRARFDGADAAATDQDEKWLGADIGETTLAGSHKTTKGQLTIESGGQDVGARADSCRLVYQPLRGNGEVSVKIHGGGQWREKTAAGVMIRGSTDAAAQSVSLLVSRDNGLYMVVRPVPGFDSTVTQIARMRAPMWVRLTREGTSVRAYRSADGKSWIRVGEVKASMGDEPIAGAVVASREAGMSAPIFESLRVSADDIAGATSTPLHEVRSLIRGGRGQGRPDNQKRISINSATMVLGLADGGTSDTTFELEGKYSLLAGQVFIADNQKAGGGATFQIFGDDEKLFDSGKLTGATGNTASFNVPVAGKRMLKLVVIDNGGGKVFSSGGFRNMNLQTIKPQKPVPKTQSAQVITVDGATYAGIDIRAVTQQAVSFARGNRRDLSIPQERVARILMPGLTADIAERIPAAGTGVMLGNGDFYEGDISTLDGVKVQVNSVIFGPREFPLRGDLLAIVLRPVATDAEPAAFEVQTADGSLFGASAISGESTGLTITDRNLGNLSLEGKTIREIRYGGDRLKWVADLRPRRVNPGPGRSAVDSFVIDATPLGPSLRLLDTGCERGLSIASGTSVTYDIDGRYNTLLCVAGVPAETLPTASVVFIVEADGKEVFRSQPRTSVQDPLSISVGTAGVKSITLRVESAGGAAGIGLFGDPLLIK